MAMVAGVAQQQAVPLLKWRDQIKGMPARSVFYCLCNTTWAFGPPATS